jgi:hypothetical protein
MKPSKGLMGLSAPQVGYDGEVIVAGRRLRVANGVMKVGQKTLQVSEDGIVSDEHGQPLGKVVNGQVVPMQQVQQQAQQQGVS